MITRLFKFNAIRRDLFPADIILNNNDKKMKKMLAIWEIV